MLLSPRGFPSRSGGWPRGHLLPNLCPLRGRSSAELDGAQSHRNGLSGSPRVSGSTNSSSRPGFRSVSRLGPPPGRRTRPRGSGGSASSRIPAYTVGRDSPLILAIRAPPPRPSVLAAAPTSRRRCFSVRCGAIRSYSPPSTASTPETYRSGMPPPQLSDKLVMRGPLTAVGFHAGWWWRTIGRTTLMRKLVCVVALSMMVTSCAAPEPADTTATMTARPLSPPAAIRGMIRVVIEDPPRGFPSALKARAQCENGPFQGRDAGTVVAGDVGNKYRFAVTAVDPEPEADPTIPVPPGATVVTPRNHPSRWLKSFAEQVDR
jgi:hypothetical protein